MRDSFLVTLPDAYLVEIGKISVQWSALEMIFEMCSIKLSGMDSNDERSWAIFAHMSFPQRLDAFAAMIEMLHENYPRLQDYKTVLSLVRESQNARNRVVHARWNYENGVATIARLTAHGKVKTSITPITVNELRRIAEQIGKASMEVLKLVVLSPETIRDG